jgi:Dyp-type peroxidase family
MTNFAEIQSIVLRGFHHSAAAGAEAHRFERFANQALAQAWLAQVRPKVTSCSAWASGAVAINVSFTHEGLRVLAGIAGPAPAAHPFCAAFVDGALRRSTDVLALGDVDGSAPPSWQAPYTTGGGPHALLTVSGPNKTAVDAALATLPGSDSERGVRLADGREHFGWVDGIGQPDIANSGLSTVPGGGTPISATTWKPVALGEFVLGYPDELGATPAAGTWAVNGSFLVFRKLAQDVTGFKSFLAALAGRTSQSATFLGAKMVGRWPDGAPLMLHPTSDPGPSTDNDFRYRSDAKGTRVPHGAHIRRANPRDDETGPTPAQTARHRMIRRSIPYDDGANGRGLLFQAIVADVERQFEFVQANWINSTLSSTALSLAADKDPIVGANDGMGKLAIPGKPPIFAWDLPRFVTVKGSVYTFVPSVSALAQLESGTLPAPWPFHA